MGFHVSLGECKSSITFLKATMILLFIYILLHDVLNHPLNCLASTIIFTPNPKILALNPNPQRETRKQ